MKQKFIVPLLIASVAGGAGISAIQSQQVTASAFSYAQNGNITNAVGNSVEITGFKSAGELGVPYTLPTYIVKDASGNTVAQTLKATVSDPSGRALRTSGDDIEFNGTTFTPRVRGYYTITFETEVEGQIKTFIEPLRVYISGEDYRVELATNSQYVVPSIVPVSTTNALKIPAPSVFLGEEAYDVFAEDATGSLDVSVVKINTSNQGTTQNLTIDSTNSFYEWMPSEAGIYEILYKYTNGTVQDYKTQKVTVKSVADYDISKLTLNFAYAGSRPTTAVLNVETSLPHINVTDKKTGATIEAYTDIKVVHVQSGKVMPVKDYAFTPTEVGSYSITYTAKNSYFGIESAPHTFIIENVKDTVAPTVLPTNQYTLNEDGTRVETVKDSAGTSIFTWDANKTDEENDKLATAALSNLESLVPSVAVVGKAVSFPAAWGSDNTTSAGNLTITRSVRLTTTGGVTQLVGDANLAVNHTFEVAGTYTVRYVIKDQANNERTMTYDLTVYATEAELNNSQNQLTTPTISLSVNQTMVNSNGKITFTIPTAKDDFDTRVQVKTFYTLGNNADSTKVEITNKNSSGLYELNLAELNLADVDKVNILAYGYNDYNQTPTIRRVSVRLIDVSASDAPEFTLSDFYADLVAVAENNLVDSQNNAIVINADGYFFDAGLNENLEPYNQKDIVTLPVVEILDDSDSNLNFTVEVRDPSGKRVNVTNSQFSPIATGSGYAYQIGGGKFVVNYSGLYIVTYSAKDASGNITVKSVGIRVRDTEKPTIELSSYDPFINPVQVGEFVYIPRASIRDNGVLLDDEQLTEGTKVPGKAGFRWYLKESSHVNSYVQGLGFAPGVAGNYVVIYEAWDTNHNTTESRAYTVVAQDTLKPTIVLEKDYILPTSVRFTQGAYVDLPAIANYYDGVEGTDNDYYQTPKEDLEIKVTVTDSNGNEVKDLQENVVTTTGGVVLKRYRFIPTKQSVYTIRYVVIDSVGNKTEVVRSVQVGDVSAPTHEWKEDYEMITEATLNQEFYFDFNNVSVIKDDETELEDIIKSVYLYNPNGNTVQTTETDAYRWVFDQVGTYELRVVLTDSAGNTKTENYTINVTEVDSDVLAPTFEFVEDYELKTTANVGDYYTFSLSDLVIEDDVDELDDIKKQVTLLNPNRRIVANSLDSDEEFSWKLDEVGAYELRIVLTDKANNTKTENFNIVVSDVHDPTLEFVEGFELKTAANVGDYFTFKLSDVVIEDDVDEIDEITTQVVLYNPSRGIVQSALSGEEEFSWKLDEVGTYELRIVLTDKSNNTKIESFNIVVCDVHAPTLEFVEDFELKTTANVGDYFTFKLSDVVIEDNLDELEDIKKQVYLYNPDRRTVQNAIDTEGEYSWKLDEVGAYELRIILTDKSKNTKIESCNIVVSQDQSKKSIISENASIAIIAVTVVIVAGAAVYFIVNNRKIKTSKGSSSRNIKK